MGFLDDDSISGTTRIPLRAHYWVDVRNCLPHDKMEIAEKLLTSATIFREGGSAQSMDTSAYRTFLVAASIVGWNLADGADDSEPWPCNNDAAIMRGVKRLPERHFLKIFQEVDKLNAPRAEADQARFPEGDDVGVPAGEAGAAAAVEVRVGAPDLEGPGAEPYGLLPAPVA